MSRFGSIWQDGAWVDISDDPPPDPWVDPWIAWADAYATAASSGGQAHVAFFGDSIVQGYYATTPLYSNSWVAQVQAALDTATGVTSGTGMVPAYERNMSTATGDARWGVTGTWTSATNYGFLSRGRSSNASGSTCTFGPVTCAGFRIAYAQTSSGGTFTATVDAGTPENINSNGATATIVHDIAASSGSHTLTITAPTSDYVFLVGVEALRNPTTGVKTSRIGFSGAESAQLAGASTAITSLPACRALNPDLAVICMGLNDAFNATSAEVLAANLTTMAEAFAADGASVALMVPPPPNPTFLSGWSVYADAIRDTAYSVQTGLIDLTDHWGSYGASSGFYHDDVHPNDAGSADIAAFVAAELLDRSA